MSTLTSCCKGLAAVTLIAASPVFIIYAVPFACGFVSDLANAAGGPVSLSITIATCVAALCWARYRLREAREEPPEAAEPRPVKLLG